MNTQIIEAEVKEVIVILHCYQEQNLEYYLLQRTYRKTTRFVKQLLFTFYTKQGSFSKLKWLKSLMLYYNSHTC